MTDQSGAVVERMNYDPFGDGPASALTRYGYTGRERDSATNLMFYRARWYDAGQGRFITQDPIGGLNRYAYTGNNPVSRIDPFGLSWSTFLEGLLAGGVSGFFIGLLFAGLFAALTALTAGTAIAALPALLGLYLGATAIDALSKEIGALLFDGSICPDDRHYRWGFLIGSVVGGIAGGAVGLRIGARFTGKGGSNDSVTVYRVQTKTESEIVTGGAFRRLREKGANLIDANAGRRNLLTKATSSDPAVQAGALYDAQANGLQSPFISTTLDRGVAESGLSGLRARGIDGEIVTIRGPRSAGLDFEETFQSLGGRTKRFKDTGLREFGIPDLFIPARGRSRSGFYIVRRE